MKAIITENPLFGITLTIISFAAGVYLNKKTRKAIFNPLLVAEILIISVLIVFRIPFSAYDKGGTFINMFLGPVTALLAYSVYRERKLVLHHLASIAAGTFAGSSRLEITVCGHEEQILLTARFDNLGKGASGAAVQNMNLMLGFPETEGLATE